MIFAPLRLSAIPSVTKTLFLNVYILTYILVKSQVEIVAILNNFSVFKGANFGKNKKCVAVSTTEALSVNLDGFDGIVCPLMNARRGQVYTCVYKNGVPLIDECCMMLDELIPILEKYDEKIYFTGDGYELVENREIKNKCQTPEYLRYSNAYGVGKIAYKMVLDGSYTTDTDLRVNYLRKPQAEREREERLKNEQRT